MGVTIIDKSSVLDLKNDDSARTKGKMCILKQHPPDLLPIFIDEITHALAWAEPHSHMIWVLERKTVWTTANCQVPIVNSKQMKY